METLALVAFLNLSINYILTELDESEKKNWYQNLKNDEKILLSICFVVAIDSFLNLLMLINIKILLLSLLQFFIFINISDKKKKYFKEKLNKVYAIDLLAVIWLFYKLSILYANWFL